MKSRSALFCAALLVLVEASLAFVVVNKPTQQQTRHTKTTSSLRAGTDLAGPLVSGEQLEMMLAELEQPLVVDAYATWSVLLAALIETTN
jgi:hypothetical protein